MTLNRRDFFRNTVAIVAGSLLPASVVTVLAPAAIGCDVVGPSLVTSGPQWVYLAGNLDMLGGLREEQR